AGSGFRLPFRRGALRGIAGMRSARASAGKYSKYDRIYLETLIATLHELAEQGQLGLWDYLPDHLVRTLAALIEVGRVDDIHKCIGVKTETARKNGPPLRFVAQR